MKGSVKSMENRFLAVLLLLICMIGAFMGKSVVSEAGSMQRAERERYHEMEKEYLKQTREVLSEAGYANSGINLTKIIDEEGRRTYDVGIHNGRINALDTAEQEELLKVLRNVAFADEACEFHHEFIVVEK